MLHQRSRYKISNFKIHITDGFFFPHKIRPLPEITFSTNYTLQLHSSFFPSHVSGRGIKSANCHATLRIKSVPNTVLARIQNLPAQRSIATEIAPLGAPNCGQQNSIPSGAVLAPLFSECTHLKLTVSNKTITVSCEARGVHSCVSIFEAERDCRYLANILFHCFN